MMMIPMLIMTQGKTMGAIMLAWVTKPKGSTMPCSPKLPDLYEAASWFSRCTEMHRPAKQITTPAKQITARAKQFIAPDKQHSPAKQIPVPSRS